MVRQKPSWVSRIFNRSTKGSSNRKGSTSSSKPSKHIPSHSSSEATVHPLETKSAGWADTGGPTSLDRPNGNGLGAVQNHFYPGETASDFSFDSPGGSEEGKDVIVENAAKQLPKDCIQSLVEDQNSEVEKKDVGLSHLNVFFNITETKSQNDTGSSTPITKEKFLFANDSNGPNISANASDDFEMTTNAKSDSSSNNNHSKPNAFDVGTGLDDIRNNVFTKKSD